MCHQYHAGVEVDGVDEDQRERRKPKGTGTESFLVCRRLLLVLPSSLRNGLDRQVLLNGSLVGAEHRYPVDGTPDNHRPKAVPDRWVGIHTANKTTTINLQPPRSLQVLT